MEDSGNRAAGISILYVEDERQAREILGSVLGTKYPGIVLHSAADGESGLELFRSHRPEIVITDLNLPVMDGIGMAAGIRALDPEAIIIAATAHCDTSHLISAIDVGMNHYLLKPIDFKKLFSILDQAITQIASARLIRSQNEHIRQLSVAVEQSPSAVIIADARGLIEYVNPRFSELTGFTADEVLGKNPRLLQSGSTDLKLYQTLWRTVTAGGVWRGQLQNRKKCGELYWESASISPVVDADGTITHFVAVKEDVTAWNELTEELRRAHDGLEQRVKVRNADLSRTVAVLQREVCERIEAEEALRENESLLRATFDNAPFELWVRDRDGCCVMENVCLVRHWGSLLGTRPEDAAVPPETLAIWLENNRRALAGEVVQGEVEYLLDGEAHSYVNIVAPIRGGGDEIRHILGLNIDISDRKRAEESLMRLNRLFKTLYEANQAIIRAGDTESLFPDICRIIVDHGGFRMAWIGLTEPVSGLVLPAAASGSCTGYLDDLRISSREQSGGGGPTGIAVREGGAVICNDFMNDPRTAPWHQQADRCGFRSSAAFALKRFGETVGALTVYAVEVNCFDRHYIELFTQLAEDISFALDNMERERQRKEATAELERSREEFKEAQRVAGVGSWQYDLKSGMLTWSDEMYRIHGETPSPIPSYSELDRRYAPESVRRLNEAIDCIMRTGEPYRLDLELRRPEGSARWITAHGEAKYGDDGTISMLRGTSFDITLRRELEQQLIQAKKLEAIGQIAGGVAHEVRNPLNAILSVTEALFNKKEIRENPKFDPFVEHIRIQVNRLAALMNDLLELGKPILVANLCSVPLNELCREAIKLLELSGSLRERSLGFICLEGEGRLVRADKVKLQQVLINLIDNALQHAPVQSEVVLQLIAADREGGGDGQAILRIRDAGSGIPEDKLARVFEPFYTGREGGTGLGLALVKHYLDYMGGSVVIWNNDPGPGCTAEVRIPLAQES